MRKPARNGRPSEFQKVRSVGLVRIDDPGYLADCQAHAAASRSYAERQEPNAGSKAGQLIETAARRWLADLLPLRPERVIAADVLPWGARAYEPRHLELDIVVGAEEPEVVLEVKWSASADAVVRGLAQVHRALDLLGHRHPDLRGVVLYVQADRGPASHHPALGGTAAADRSWLPLTPGEVRALRLDLATLLPYLDEGAHAIISAAQDEADATVAARQERAVRRAAGLDDRSEAPAQPRRAREDVIAHVDATPDPSPFLVLQGLWA